MSSTIMMMQSQNNMNTALIAAKNARARTAECKLMEQVFDAKAATVQQKRDYASCIDNLYPSEMSNGVEVGLKVTFVICLLGAVYGFSRARDLDEKVIFTFFGFVVPAIAITVGTLLVYGIMWVFS